MKHDSKGIHYNQTKTLVRHNLLRRWQSISFPLVVFVNGQIQLNIITNRVDNQ